MNNKPDVNEDKKNEKIGRTIMNVTYFVFAVRFIVIVTVAAGIVMYFLDKPLWIAPVIGLGAFVIYRLFWRLIWMFIGWSSRQ